MLLGKRPRLQVMKKTSSNTEFSVEAGAPETTAEHGANIAPEYRGWRASPYVVGGVGGSSVGGYNWTSMVSPRNPRRHSADFAVETANFLKICGLCKRRLAPGKDIYMYRGEIAFCSSECRQQQMNVDERKDKCSVTSRMNGDLPQASVPASTVAEPSGSGGAAGETVAAA